MEELADIVRELKPTVLIGAAAVPNVFTPEIIKDMASFNASPVIFALSNPTSKAECTAEQASVQYEVHHYWWGFACTKLIPDKKSGAAELSQKCGEKANDYIFLQAYIHSEGRALFASGSPFPAFKGFGKTFEPGQGNNAYIFPGARLEK